MVSMLRTQWDRVAAWVAAGVGLVLLVIGYFKVSGTAYPAEQLPYLASAGLGALFLLGVAGSLWISADLRDEYAKLDEIGRTLAALGAGSATDSSLDGGTADVPLPAPRPTQPAADPAPVVEPMPAVARAAERPSAAARRRVRSASRV